MKRGFAGTLGRVSVLMLCLLFSLAGLASTRTEFVINVASGEWTPELLASCPSEGGCEAKISNCTFGPLPSLKLAANESAVYGEATWYRCPSTGVRLIPIEITKGDPKLSVVATFESDFNVALLELPTVTPANALGTGARPVQIDERYETALTLFNTGNALGYVTVSVFDGKGQLATLATLTLRPGDNFIRVRTTAPSAEELADASTQFVTVPRPLATARLEIRPGTSGFGCGAACAGPEAIAGVALVNWSEGGSARVVPLTSLD